MGKIEAIIKPHAVMYLQSAAMAAHVQRRKMLSNWNTFALDPLSSTLRSALCPYRPRDMKANRNKAAVSAVIIFDDQRSNDVYRMALI